MVFANVNPAIASQRNNNKIIDQMQMPNIQRKAEDVTKRSPYDTNLEYSNKILSKQGLNEIQGTADFNKMKRAPNEVVPPIVSDAEKALDKVGDKINSAKNDTENTVGSALDKAGNVGNYVKDKAGDVVNSITDKAEDTVKSITNKVRS
jgi:hypothetical protein